ncbi:hypothetical protein ACQ4PT_020751 [Festuca glaucescens]
MWLFSPAAAVPVQLFTWGWNQRGTLGHPPETKTESSPAPVDAPRRVKIVQVCAGSVPQNAIRFLMEAVSHWIFGARQRSADGIASRWMTKGAPMLGGGNEYGQCGEEPERKEDGTRALRRDIPIPQRCALKLKVRQVAAGGTHSVVLTQEGHVWTWGQPWPPGDIKKISTPVRVQGLEHVSMIAVGAFHNLALSEDGILWAWGNNEYGQLGIGDTQPRSQPIRVEGLSDLSLVDIAAGGWHSAALTKDGESLLYNYCLKLSSSNLEKRPQPTLFCALQLMTHCDVFCLNCC